MVSIDRRGIVNSRVIALLFILVLISVPIMGCSEVPEQDITETIPVNQEVHRNNEAPTT